VNVETLSADVTVDCLGKLCPVPVIETSKAVRRMEAGTILLLIADDPGSDPDIHAWCDETGNTLLRMDQEGKVFRFWIHHQG
jgi:tRNA 2-thiouridine synthesizing protein A